MILKIFLRHIIFIGLGVALIVAGLLVFYIPNFLDQNFNSISFLLKAVSNVLFYSGVAAILVSLLSLCVKCVWFGLRITGQSPLERLNFKWNWAMSGFVLLVLGFALGEFPLILGGELSETAQQALKEVTEPMFYIGLALISASIIYTTIQEKMIDFWRGEVLTKLRENIDEVSNKYISAVRIDTLKEAINQSGAEEANANLSLFISKVFGEHCAKDQGLFEALKRKVFPYLETGKVHRSNYFKKITIDDADGKHRWDETCEFNLHCIKLDSDYGDVPANAEVDYELKYSASMKIKGSPNKIEDFWDLEIRVFTDELSEEGELIFDSKEVLKFNEDKDDIVVSTTTGSKVDVNYDRDGDLFSFNFSKEIKLKKAFTKVVLKETSHIPENYFTLSTREPSCGMDIDIHLPSGWNFEEHNVFNPDKSWSITRHPSNRLSLHNGGWILPGLVMNCRWDSNRQKDLI